ncbi:GTP-binding protein Rheb [Aphelenchoides avenae]|nr:GTP-binding protein Rheb [Aphelenchus avenae]
MAPPEPTALQRKIALMGYPCVGKSSITMRFVQGTFPDSYDTTIEDFHVKTVTFMGRKYNLKITDTAGQQEYSLFPRSCLLDVDGYILVYAINDRRSFEILRTIYDKIVDNVGDANIPIVIVGNKVDLQHGGRVVPSTEGLKLAEEWKAEFIETSARDNMDVQKVFDRILRSVEISRGNLPRPKNSNCVIS